MLFGFGGGQQFGDQGLDVVCDVVVDYVYNVEGLVGGIGQFLVVVGDIWEVRVGIVVVYCDDDVVGLDLFVGE